MFLHPFLFFSTRHFRIISSPAIMAALITMKLLTAIQYKMTFCWNNGKICLNNFTDTPNMNLFRNMDKCEI